MEVLCIGIGNAYRQDDSVGLYVAEALQERNLPGVKVSLHSREGISLINAWEGAQAVILVDAVISGAAPGTVYQFYADRQPLPIDCFPRSTHTISVTEAVELARQLGKLPDICIVYGIEGASFDPGTDLTPAAAASVPLLVDMIAQTIESLDDDR